MKLLVLAVLLSIVQAAPPVPRHTPDKSSSSGQEIKGDANADKSPSPFPTPTIQQTREASTQKNGTHTPASPNTEQSIAVTKLPAVSVNDVNVKKDWMDKTAWFFSGLLIFIGALGICAAVKTLRAINRQADLMDGQLKALINSERAWVMVDIEWQKGAHIFEGTSGDGSTNTGIYVEYICRNQGKSFAQITEKGYVLKISPVPLPQEPDFSNIDIFHHACEYVAPATAAEPYRLSGIHCDGHRKSNNLMVIYGRVKYTDVYGEHETRFGYMITPMGNLDRLPAGSYPKYNEHT